MKPKARLITLINRGATDTVPNEERVRRKSTQKEVCRASSFEYFKLSAHIMSRNATKWHGIDRRAPGGSERKSYRMPAWLRDNVDDTSVSWLFTLLHVCTVNIRTRARKQRSTAACMIKSPQGAKVPLGNREVFMITGLWPKHACGRES